MGELPMKVLLVDDESYMTEYLKKLVDWKSYGFEEVLTASGGSIARDLIEQKKPELLVTDIRMPRVSGLDLVKYIDEKNLSAYITDVKMEKAAELLSGTDRWVHEIMESVGYQKSQYFSKIFKEKYGVTPNEYRRTHRG